MGAMRPGVFARQTGWFHVKPCVTLAGIADAWSVVTEDFRGTSPHPVVSRETTPCPGEAGAGYSVVMHVVMPSVYCRQCPH